MNNFVFWAKKKELHKAVELLILKVNAELQSLDE
jgi:hypothetical protein